MEISGKNVPCRKNSQDGYGMQEFCAGCTAVAAWMALVMNTVCGVS